MRTLRETGARVVSAKVIGIGKDPESLVRKALAYRDRDDDLDGCWCVVDVDAHAKLRQSISLAAKSGVMLAISNPCFEVWLLWHYENHTGHIERANLRRMVRRYGHPDNKNLPTSFPFDRNSAASSRAAQAAPACVPGACGPNPSSSVVTLVDHITGRTSGPRKS
ncbi:RloB family protein [Frankia sp. AgB32]|nr:RloB family protein [Frankia sp. AgB32]